MRVILRYSFYILLITTCSVFSQSKKVLSGPMLSYVNSYGTQIWFLLDGSAENIEIDVRDYENDNQEVLYADVTVSDNAPIGDVADLNINITNLNGGLDVNIPISLSVGQITENFESGFSESLNWVLSGDSDWENVYTIISKSKFSNLS